ncbi:MAG: phytanoyl-CoA dioxygenase family protein [Planctomycetes bacterium]|nr:phytanoyl-CoA dioxygenase family protein [Planctomycetota bacterium]
MRLSEAQISEFFERGYLVAEGLFSAAELEPLRASFGRLLVESEGLATATGMHRGARFVFEGPVLHRVVWAGALEPELLNMAEDPRLLGPVSQLLGSDQVEHLLNQCHFKMPGDGVAFAWHQDSQNRHYGTPDWTDVNGRGSFVQSILAVDATPAESGPLVVYPYSCRAGHLGLSGEESEVPFDASEREALLLGAGSVVFFGPYTVHGSGPNQSQNPRRVLINGYAAPGANRFVYPGSGTGRTLHAGAS